MPSEQLFPNKRSLSYSNLNKSMKTYITFKRRRAVAAQMIGAFVFATWIVQSLFLLNPNLKLLATSVQAGFVRPGLNSKLLVFSCSGSYDIKE